MATTVTTRYTWDAGLQGWVGEGATSVAHVTGPTQEGTGALQATETLGAGFGELRFNDNSGVRDISGPGSLLTAWVLVPADATGTAWQGRIEVQDSGFGWNAGPNFSLTPGVWQQLSYDPGITLLSNCRSLGFAIGGTDVNATQSIYIDTFQQTLITVDPEPEPEIPVDQVGNMLATFTDPDGTVWQLTDTAHESGWFTTFGVGGWGARPYEFTLDPLPRGGDSVRFIRAEPARLTWPLHIWGETHLEFVQRYRALRRAFLMTVHRGQSGTLRVSRPDGTAREIDVFYEEGWGGEPGENWLYANPVLTLLAPDGYWRDVQQTTVYREFAAGSPYLNPYRTVTSSQVLGDTTIVNPGEVPAWPEWTITGPASAIEATNNTTGQTFTITYTLTAGQSITITTLQPTVRGPVGENIASALNWPAAYLWPLLPGSNSVSFDVTGAGAGTTITLSYHARYEGA